MAQPSAMLSRLDAETRARQTEADTAWLDLMAAGATKDRYIRQLVKVYGFEAPLEAALAYTPSLVVAERREVSRAGLIVQDLLALGMTPHALTRVPQCLEIGPFQGPAEALGWKYVSDRASLLHAPIKRHLVSRLPELAHAVTYLSAHDGLTNARWQQLGALLDEVSGDAAVADRIVAAAHEAFACMTGWFR